MLEKQLAVVIVSFAFLHSSNRLLAQNSYPQIVPKAPFSAATAVN